jgi:aspartate aminotransferase
LLADPTKNHEHLPLLGHPQLLNEAQNLIFDAPPAQAATIASIQTIAGTGANHLGALFLVKACRPRAVWISNPSWINHTEIWRMIDDGIERRLYPYFDANSYTVDFDGMLSTLSSETSEGDVIILHGCAHNPTGLDPSRDQWMQIAALCEQKRLFPFFDVA